MEQVKNYYKRFVKEGFDENGILNKFEIDCPDNYNFGYDIIDKFGEIDPDRRALIHIDLQENRHDFSYSQLSKLSTQAANLFKSYGIKKGDKVMLVLKRNYQFWIAIIALIKLGAVAIPATHLLTTHDFTYRFERASVKAIVCTGYNPDIAKYVDEAQEEIHADGLVKFIANGHRDGWIPFDDEIAGMPETMERVQTDTREHMLLYFTSGTTGYPKMVVHNHRYALAHIQTAAHWQNVDSDGVHLTISDTGWGKAAWGKLFGQMSLGACVFVYDFDKFIPTDMLRIMQNYKITSFCAPPTMFRFFIKEGLENYDLSSLKYSAIAGEALNPEVYNKWLEFTGLKLMEAFGQTESTALLANLVGMTPKPGSMGKPTPLYDVRIVDDECNEVKQGEVGEVVVFPPKDRKQHGIFITYYNNENLYEKVWRHGVYHTGDTAYKDENGYFWYVGRADDLIKTRGFRVGPFEVENVLMQYPNVLECAVIGVPDKDRGQAIKAIVKMADGAPHDKELENKIKTFCNKRMASYKWIQHLEIVDEFPKTISGKIKRTDLRENHKA